MYLCQLNYFNTSVNLLNTLLIDLKIKMFVNAEQLL